MNENALFHYLTSLHFNVKYMVNKNYSKFKFGRKTCNKCFFPYIIQQTPNIAFNRISWLHKHFKWFLRLTHYKLLLYITLWHQKQFLKVSIRATLRITEKHVIDGYNSNLLIMKYIWTNERINKKNDGINEWCSVMNT